MKDTYEFCALIATVFLYGFIYFENTREKPNGGLGLHRQKGPGRNSICSYFSGGEEAGKMGTEAERATRQSHGSLTCSHNTAHSGRARTRRSSLEGCWGSAHRLPHACRGSGDMHPHTFFQSTLWRQDQDHLYINVSPASHTPQSLQFLPLSRREQAVASPADHRDQPGKTWRAACPGQGRVGCGGVGRGHSRHMGNGSSRCIHNSPQILSAHQATKGEDQ